MFSWWPENRPWARGPTVPSGPYPIRGTSFETCAKRQGCPNQIFTKFSAGRGHRWKPGDFNRAPGYLKNDVRVRSEDQNLECRRGGWQLFLLLRFHCCLCRVVKTALLSGHSLAVTERSSSVQGSAWREYVVWVLDILQSRLLEIVHDSCRT